MLAICNCIFTQQGLNTLACIVILKCQTSFHPLKALRYNLEAEWRNRYPGGRTLDRDDLFELGKADILNNVASLQVLQPAKWESLLMDTLWDKMAPKVLDIFVEAAQGRSPG